VLGARFHDAGFVCVGKTNLPEFGVQPTTQPLACGPTRNPWDTARSSGGSSGGAAAAVAAGMVPVAHAGDIGGSIRIPSAWCGVVGLKPSRGRTSTVPLVDPNMVEHVITRSVQDCAAVLDAVAGATDADVYQLPPSSSPYARLDEPEGLRIGLLTHVDASAITVDPECVEAAERTGALLESLGHDVERAGPAALFDDEVATHSHATMTREIRAVLDGIAATLGRPLVPEDVEPYTWAMAAEGAAVSDEAYAQSQIWERAYTARISTWWTGGFDLLLTPATATPPLPLDSLVPPAETPLAILPVFQSIWCFAIPFNVTGQPAISIPGERSAAGLPIGCQLVAPLGREDRLLQVAGQLEATAAARRAAVAGDARAADEAHTRHR
jgi:amidase